jgi:cytochrome c oxidase subunit 3
MKTEDINNNSDVTVELKAKKFALWLFIIASFMIFASLSSGFIVYTASGIDKGLKVILPNAFILSTVLIVVSSISMHLAFRAAKRSDYAKQKLFLLVTILLGVGFFFSQFHAWNVLIDQGVYFVNYNASQSFIYVFTGFHLAHIIAGVIVLLIVLLHKLGKLTQARNIFRMELAALFWHFLDILWIYIYVFLLLNQ